MLSLFRRAPAARRARAGRVVLRLESFESRATPSGDGVPLAEPPPGGGGKVANQAPQITDFTATDLGGGRYVISGRVIDESPGGLTITFGGSVPSLNGQTTTTYADGTFSVVVRLQTDGTDIGYLLATTQDAQGLASNEASVYIHPAP